MDRPALRAFVWLALLMAVLAGCGRREVLVPAEGVLTLDGKPLAGATVFFLSDGGEARTATAKTQADGAFCVATYGDDGIAPGNYRVIVDMPKATSETNTQPTGGTPASRERAARRKATSGRTSDGPSIPRRYTDSSTTPLRCTIPLQDKLLLDLRSTGR